MTINDPWVPNFLLRVAHEDIQEDVDDGEREYTPDADLDCDEQG